MSDYREKLLAVVRDSKLQKNQGALLQAVVPAVSVEGGVLVDRMFRKLRATGVRDVAVKADRQVPPPAR